MQCGGEVAKIRGGSLISQKEKRSIQINNESLLFIIMKKKEAEEAGSGRAEKEDAIVNENEMR